MTIDERLEKLTERHEALTGTMELFQAELRDFQTELREMDRKWEARFEKLGDKIDTLAGAVGDLVRVARLHEERIQDLENRG